MKRKKDGLFDIDSSPVLIRPERVSPVRSLGCVINPRANAMFYHSLAPDSEFGVNRGTSIV